jgi:hypothetical protein
VMLHVMALSLLLPVSSLLQVGWDCAGGAEIGGQVLYLRMVLNSGHACVHLCIYSCASCMYAC